MEVHQTILPKHDLFMCEYNDFRGESRHFNINDFTDMGRIFGETVLDYQTALENKNKQFQITLGTQNFPLRQ